MPNLAFWLSTGNRVRIMRGTWAGMRQKGYDVASTKVSVPRGKAQEVKVPQKELFLIFVASGVCSGREAQAR